MIYLSDIYAKSRWLTLRNSWRYVQCRCQFGQMAFIARLLGCFQRYCQFVHRVPRLLENRLKRWVVCTTQDLLSVTHHVHRSWSWSVPSQGAGSLDVLNCISYNFLVFLGVFSNILSDVRLGCFREAWDVTISEATRRFLGRETTKRKWYFSCR